MIKIFNNLSKNIIRRFFSDKNLDLNILNNFEIEKTNTLFYNLIPEDFENKKLVKLIFSYFENEEYYNIKINDKVIINLFNELENFEFKLKLLKFFYNKLVKNSIINENFMLFWSWFFKNIIIDKNVKINDVDRLLVIISDINKLILFDTIYEDLKIIKFKIENYINYYIKNNYNISKFNNHKQKEILNIFSRILFCMNILKFNYNIINRGLDFILQINIKKNELNQLVTYLFLLNKNNYKISLNDNLKKIYVLEVKKDLNDNDLLIVLIQNIIHKVLEKKRYNLDYYFLFYIISLNIKLINHELITVIEKIIMEKIKWYNMKQLLVIWYSMHLSNKINLILLKLIYQKLLSIKNEIKDLNSSDFYWLIIQFRLVSKDVLEIKNLKEEKDFNDSLGELSFLFYNNIIKFYTNNINKFKIETNIRCIYELSNKSKLLFFKEYINLGFNKYLTNINEKEFNKLSLFDVITFMFILKRFLIFDNKYLFYFNLFFNYINNYINNYNKNLAKIEKDRLYMIINNSENYLMKNKEKIDNELYSKFKINFKNLRFVLSKYK